MVLENRVLLCIRTLVQKALSVDMTIAVEGKDIFA